MMDQLLFQQVGAKSLIKIDNDTGYVFRALDHWGYINKITLDCGRPGKPIGNAFIKTFDGRLRDACLDLRWFLSLDGAKIEIKARQIGLCKNLTLQIPVVHHICRSCFVRRVLARR